MNDNEIMDTRNTLVGRKVDYRAWVPGESGAHEFKHFEGTFLSFGVDFEEFAHGFPHRTSAIIVGEDGTIHNLELNHVKFVVEKSP